MERIQKALEKARQQRSTNARDENLIPRAEARVESSEQPDHSEITYSQTRIVPTSQDRLRENRVVANIKDHPQADVFRVLRTKVLHRIRREGIKSIGITSPTKGSGKSMIASNLAVSLSMEMNHTVMLVDLDLRRPSLHEYFELESERGLTTFLQQGAELPELLFNPGIDRLVILPAGKTVPHSSELLSTPRMGSLVKDITGRYSKRVVIFDLPPLLHLDDALAFLPQVESTLLVVEEGVNTPAEVNQSLHLLEDSHFLGTVLNKAQRVKQSPY